MRKRKKARKSSWCWFRKASLHDESDPFAICCLLFGPLSFKRQKRWTPLQSRAVNRFFGQAQVLDLESLSSITIWPRRGPVTSKKATNCSLEEERDTFLWRIDTKVSLAWKLDCWGVNSAFQPPSYFFGTIHVPYTRVWDAVSTNTKKAFHATDRVDQFLNCFLKFAKYSTTGLLWIGPDKSLHNRGPHILPTSPKGTQSLPGGF